MEGLFEHIHNRKWLCFLKNLFFFQSDVKAEAASFSKLSLLSQSFRSFLTDLDPEKLWPSSGTERGNLCFSSQIILRALPYPSVRQYVSMHLMILSCPKIFIWDKESVKLDNSESKQTKYYMICFKSKVTDIKNRKKNQTYCPTSQIYDRCFVHDKMRT